LGGDKFHKPKRQKGKEKFLGSVPDTQTACEGFTTLSRPLYSDFKGIQFTAHNTKCKNMRGGTFGYFCEQPAGPLASVAAGEKEPQKNARDAS